MAKRALIVGVSGVSGIVGGNLVDRLLAEGNLKVYGVARRPGCRASVTPVAFDLQDTRAALEARSIVSPDMDRRDSG